MDNDTYDYHYLNIGNDKGRGLIMLTDKRLKAQEVSFGDEFEENLFVEITLNNKDKLLVGVMYRSDSGLPENNCELLNRLNLISSQNYSHLLVMGDFNLPKINWDMPHFGNHSEFEQNILDCLQENYLFQDVNKPTRCRGKDTPHILDLILSNGLNISQLEYQSPFGKSDHSVLVFNYHCYAELKDKEEIRQLYDKTDYEGLKNSIKQLNWQEVLFQNGDDINSIWSSFHSKIQELESKCVPKVKIKSRRKHNPFPLDDKAKELIKKKHCMSMQLMRNNNDENRRAYNKARNKVKGAIEKLRKEFEKSLAKEAKTNPKKLWKYINSKSKIRPGIGDINIDPSDEKSPTTNNDEEKAQVFAEYFFECIHKRTTRGDPTASGESCERKNGGLENRREGYN